MRTSAYLGAAVVLMVSFVLLPVRGAGAEMKTYPAMETMKGSAAEGHNSEGMKQYDVGKWADAEMHFSEAVKADGNSAEAHYNHALSLDKLGRHKEAAEEFDQALKLAPDNKAIAESPILKAHLKKM
jgi:Flp pilus assembly protein TadD